MGMQKFLLVEIKIATGDAIKVQVWRWRYSPGIVWCAQWIPCIPSPAPEKAKTKLQV